jgi:predicted dehydrogenase
VDYCGVCDFDADKAARAADLVGTKPHADLGGMLADEKPDGLVILVRPDAAPGVIRTAIESGVPFMTEKPPATSADVHRELTAAAGDLPHVIAYNRRFTPYVTKAREWIGELRIQSVEATICRHRRLEVDFTSTAVHAVDAAIFLAGGRLAEARVEVVRTDDVVNAFLSAWTVEDCHVSLVVAPNSGYSEEEYVVRTSSRNARVVHPQGKERTGGVSLYEGKELVEELAAHDFGMDDLPSASGILGEHRHFVDVLEGTCASLSSLRDTLTTQIVREACGGPPDGVTRLLREIDL